MEGAEAEKNDAENSHSGMVARDPRPATQAIDQRYGACSHESTPRAQGCTPGLSRSPPKPPEIAPVQWTVGLSCQLTG
jgi:hypothetical protein